MSHLSPHILTLITDAIRELSEGVKKGDVVAKVMKRTGWSKDKVYRTLKQHGYNSGRKVRADKGTSKVNDEVVANIAAMQLLAQRKNGKDTLKTTTARSIALSNGLPAHASTSTLNRRMRALKFTQARNQSSTYQSMRSLHPNHVHQVDPSLCLLYYTPKGQQTLGDDEIYKNKPEWVAKIGSLKCWRYVLTDHYSASIYVKYYESAGENAENLWDFLQSAWAKKEQQLMHGVPKLLVWDKGTANKATAITKALKVLEVVPLVHAPGNAQAKGGVENGNNIVETQFESRLTLEPVANIDELNEKATLWCEAYNADAIEFYNAKLSRANKARSELWHTITQEQLRTLPEPEVCRTIFVSNTATKSVGRNLCVNFKHPKSDKTLAYSVAHFNGICVGDKVKVTPLFYKDLSALIELNGYEGMLTHECTPLDIDEAGFDIRSAVWGEEYKQLPHDATTRAHKMLSKTLYPDQDDEEAKKLLAKKALPFGGEMKAISTIKPVDTNYLTPAGKQIEVSNDSHITPMPIEQHMVRAREQVLLTPTRAMIYMHTHDLFTPEARTEIHALLKQKYAETGKGISEQDIEERFNKFTLGITSVAVSNH